VRQAGQVVASPTQRPPPKNRPRIGEAVRTGRAHPDEYVRHRTAVPVGEPEVGSTEAAQDTITMK
jgi:hypothetical protein